MRERDIFWVYAKRKFAAAVAHTEVLFIFFCSQCCHSFSIHYSHKTQTMRRQKLCIRKSPSYKHKHRNSCKMRSLSILYTRAHTHISLYTCVVLAHSKRSIRINRYARTRQLQMFKESVTRERHCVHPQPHDWSEWDEYIVDRRASIWIAHDSR